MKEHRMTKDYSRLISKYALLLGAFALLEYLVRQYLREKTLDFGDYQILMATIPTGLTFLLNIVTALLLNADTKAIGIKTNYVTLATILYRPIGVCAFLLFIIFDKNKLGQPH
jgi:hypothetical protein